MAACPGVRVCMFVKGAAPAAAAVSRQRDRRSQAAALRCSPSPYDADTTNNLYVGRRRIVVPVHQQWLSCHSNILWVYWLL